MKLIELQRLFTSMVPALIDKAIELGFEVRFGEAWRPPEMAALNAKKGSGIKASLHIDRLAIDLNLDKDGVWQKTTEAHRELGEWWERQHPLCRWGGRFGDGNHYSVTYQGRR